MKTKVINCYNNFIKPWSNSLLVLVVSIVIGFFTGLSISDNLAINFIYDESKVLLILSIITIIATYFYIYYKHENKKNHREIEIDATSLKYVFYSISFFIFSIYYCLNRNYLLSSYSLNKFGIAQQQYIFIINFIMFILASVVIYSFIYKSYSIKKIGKDGIEFEPEKAAIKNYNLLVNQYAEIIDDYSDNICDLENLMYVLKDNNLIRNDYTVEEFILVIEYCLKSFIYKNPDLKIAMVPIKDFDAFVKINLSYNLFDLKKISANMNDKNRVYSYEDKIFVKYYISLLNDYIMCIIDCKNPYPYGLGKLLYSYLFSIETTYSKYLIKKKKNSAKKDISVD